MHLKCPRCRRATVREGWHGRSQHCVCGYRRGEPTPEQEIAALRSRVEALERALNRADLFFELTCNTLEEMLGDDVPEDRQREVCEGMIAAIQDYDRARAALQPDKGEGPSYHRVEGAFRSEAP